MESRPRPPCPWQDRIEGSVLREEMSGEERAHVAVCADCRTLATVIRAVMSEGRSTERASRERVPPALEILAKVRSRDQAVDTDRSTSAPAVPAGDRNVLWPIIWVERVAAVVAIVLAVGVGWPLAEGLAAISGTSLPWPPTELLGSLGSSGSPKDVGAASLLMVPVLAFCWVALLYGLTGFGDVSGSRR